MAPTIVEALPPSNHRLMHNHLRRPTRSADTPRQAVEAFPSDEDAKGADAASHIPPLG
jgi:hypothetical protein